MTAITRLTRVLLCLVIVAVLPAFGTLTVAAAPGQTASASITSAHMTPFLTLNGRDRAAIRKRSFHAGGHTALTSQGTSEGTRAHLRDQPTARPATNSRSAGVAAPL